MENDERLVPLRRGKSALVDAIASRVAPAAEALSIVEDGVLRTTGLISISAQDLDELEQAVADIEQAAIQASCETRRLWGQQAQAFSAAALPLARLT